MSPLTASKTWRASSCDTLSRMAPHSTRTVSSGRSIATSQRSRSKPSPVPSTSTGSAGGEPENRVDTRTEIGAPLISTRAALISVLGIARSVVAPRTFGLDQ